VVIAGLPLPARAQIASIPDENTPRFAVQGVVLNSLTQQPIARALVESNSAAMLTDGEGRFELNLPEGTAEISVRRPGYNSRGQDVNHAVNVTANTPELTFTLTPEASITGHVTLSTGEPAEGIAFVAYRRALIEGHERWATAGSATTDSEGTFRMSNLDTPGFWVVCSVAQLDNGSFGAAASQASPAAANGYASVCYPGPIPVAAAGVPANALALAPGQQAELEIPLTRQPFYRVAIAVPSVSGTEGVDIQFHDATGRSLAFPAEWNANKRVTQAYLPSGQYYAEVRPLATGTVRYGRIDFRVGAAPVSNLRVTLFPLHPVPVEIHKEFSANAQNGTQSGLISGLARGAEGPGMSLSLIDADSAAGDIAGGGLEPRPGSADGSLFQMETAAPGRYWVRAYAYESYVASITSGGADLTREPLEIGAGSSTAPIHVTLRNDGGQIQCTVVRPESSHTESGSGGEMYISWVYAIPTSQTASPIPQGQGLMQKAEPVKLANLAPGTYRVVAYDKFQQIDLGNPQQLAEIAAKGQTVTVGAGATVSVQVDLIHAANESPNDILEGIAID